MGLFSITEAMYKIIGNINANCGKSISLAPCKLIEECRICLFEIMHTGVTKWVS
jgi:hypothetical protein